MPGDDPLLQPFQLKHLTLKNRIMSTAHEPAYSEDGMPKDRYRRYHLEKARGGIAMTMTAGSALVAEDSPAAFGNLHAYRDEIVPWLKQLTDDCHSEGCAVMIQLTHLGRRTTWNNADWLPVVAPSRVREAAHRTFPKEMEDWDIARIVSRYADAAERMQAAGLDGIELECYGHLIDGFWSPLTNRRDDEYGGSLRNRMRFSDEVLTAIRDRVGPEFIVGLRLVTNEASSGGITPEEGIEIARRTVAGGNIDFLNVIRGRVDSDNRMADVIPVQGMRSSPHLDYAGEIRAATDFPVFHASRISDVATARHAVAEGRLDMVGMTRAHIADPHIVAKIAKGHEARIRPCVGATYCLGRIYEGNEAFCIHNASTGREGSLPHSVESSSDRKRVVVVGAGPGGLEAARVAAERGHSVVLMEAQDQAGGQIRLIASNPRRAEMIGIVDWRISELKRLGVDLRFNLLADTGDVIGDDPDVVVIATGGVPDGGDMPGAELAISGWDILSGAVSAAGLLGEGSVGGPVPGGPGAGGAGGAGGEVLVYDDHGQEQALTVAEYLAARGATVEIATPERALGIDVGGINYAPYGRAFAAAGVRRTIDAALLSLARNGNRLVAEFGSEFGGTPVRRHFDQVVIEHGTIPADDLYFALKPLSVNLGEVDQPALIAGQAQRLVTNPAGKFRLLRIGDAVASRNIHAAIYEGMRFTVTL